MTYKNIKKNWPWNGGLGSFTRDWPPDWYNPIYYSQSANCSPLMLFICLADFVWKETVRKSSKIFAEIQKDYIRNYIFLSTLSEHSNIDKNLIVYLRKILDKIMLLLF